LTQIYEVIAMLLTRALLYFVKRKKIPGRLDIGYSLFCT